MWSTPKELEINLADAASVGPFADGKVAGKYKLERLLGQGGMGAVFEATHLVTNKRVAIKCQLRGNQGDAEEVGRFLREARAAARVSHPNIVDVYDVGEASGSLFLVMEYLEGAPLSSLLGGRPLPIDEVARTMVSAMRGVQAAHRKGVIHRDLKPDNIFLCCEGDGLSAEPKVLDFGVAKLQAVSDGPSPTLTRAGTVMGTPHYMSPEQAEDSSRVDERSDIYALGVILYELLAGQRPYQASSLTSLLLQVTRGKARPLRELRPAVPQKLEDIVMRAMAREPSARFQDIGALLEALQPFAGPRGLQPLASREGGGAAAANSQTPLAIASLAHSERRTVRYTTAIGVLIVVALALGTWWLRARPSDALAPTTVATRPIELTATPKPEAPPPSVLPAPIESVQPAAETTPAEQAGAATLAKPERNPSRAVSKRAVANKLDKPVVPDEAAPSTDDLPATTLAPGVEGRGRLKVGLARDQF